MTDTAGSQTRHRLDSIDLLRGLVIVLMALDHARDFFGLTPYPPEDLSRASAALFLTRWVTHFCAPVFLFLAGLGAALYQRRLRSRGELSVYLLQRGLFLIVLELTVINLSWARIFAGGFAFIQVIWVIGCSMILLAGGIWLPRRLLLALTVATIAGHNLLDGIQPAALGALAPLWGILHAQHWIPLGESFSLLVIYPLIPWPAVMALGYLCGDLYSRSPAERRRALTRLGAALTLVFVALRWIDLYGDPSPWSAHQGGALSTVLEFLNTTKYPPSLLFLLMTLGPAIWLLPVLERARGPLARWTLVFGRVPLFFYVIHVPAIHLMAAIYSLARYGEAGWWFQSPAEWPAAYSPHLGLVYAAWILATVLLYPACRWYAGVKRRRTSRLLTFF